LVILRRFGRLLIALPVFCVMMVGCDEDNNTVAPPPPPPQIALERVAGMESDDVYDVFVDSQNRLWVATDVGVYLFPSSQGPFPDPKADGSPVQYFTDRDGLPNLRCRALNALNGNVFAGTWGGGIGIYTGVLPWTAVRPSDGLVTGRVFDLAADDTSMWISTVAGVAQYLDNGAPDLSDRLVDHTDLFGDDIFTSILVRTNVGGIPANSEVWVSQAVGDSGGVPVPGGIKVVTLPGAHRQFFTPETSGIPTDNVAEVAYDPIRNVIWSAHSGTGVATVDVPAKLWKTYTMADGLISSLAGSVAINHLGTKWDAGTVWIATQLGVTKMAPDGSVMNYGSGSGLPGVRVRKVVIDRNDDVWLCFVSVGAARVIPPR
jgi:ligand-binding sensor domain-containing protein